MRDFRRKGIFFQQGVASICMLAALVACDSGTSESSQAGGMTDAIADQRATNLLAQMSNDEKLQLIHSQYAMSDVPGGGGGYVQGVPRLHIPDINMVDSSTGSGSSTQASTTFPATIALAASWDTQLAYDYGAQVAQQLRAQGFSMGLGGGVNLAREPRGGRLFEYLGEDPVLAGMLLAQRTKGTQDHQVIATIKHFAGNQQETNRMGGVSQIDERTLRELYLLPFEMAVELSAPGSVMCSYNRLSIVNANQQANNDYSCENSQLLSILKNDWGFKGQVQSDWGATHSTVKAITAGLDEEEDVGPSVFFTPQLVQQALNNGTVQQARLDDMVRRKLRTMIRVGVMDNPAKAGGVIDFAAATAFTQSVAEQSIVLLKNANQQLPLDANTLRKIVVIGAHADTAVLTGGGSGNTRMPVSGNFSSCGGIGGLVLAGTSGSNDGNGCGWWSNPWIKIETPIVTAIQNLAPNAVVAFAGNSDQTNPFRAYTPEEIAAAVTLAKNSDVAVVVVSQPSGEDFGDQLSLGLSNPSNQDALIQQVVAANPKTIVVLENGNPVLMPWKDSVAAIVEAWYPGEGGGRAIANVLFGKVNPSGKLPVTFPARDQDTPTWNGNGIMQQNPIYAEGLKMGYRWYDAQKIAPLFEFGFGLSYTNFTYSGLSVQSDAQHNMTVTFSVTNAGAVAGAEVPQVYLGLPADGIEPPQRLVGWSKIMLAPGATQQVTVKVTPKMQSIWDVTTQAWKFIPNGIVNVGSSSRSMHLNGKAT